MDLLLITNPTSYESFEEFVQYILNYAIGLSVVIAVTALIIAGFKYILAMGDEKKIQSATQSLIFALVGMAIVFIAPMVVQFVVNQLNAG